MSTVCGLAIMGNMLLLISMFVVALCRLQVVNAECAEGHPCVSSKQCESYKQDSQKLKQLTKGSSEYNRLISTLK